MALLLRAHEAMWCRPTHMHMNRVPALSLSLSALHFPRHEAATPNRGCGRMGNCAGTGGGEPACEPWPAPRFSRYFAHHQPPRSGVVRRHHNAARVLLWQGRGGWREVGTCAPSLARRRI